MIVTIDTEKGTIDTESTHFNLNDVIDTIAIPARYFDYMLNQNESFTKEMKDDLIVVLSRAVGSMFMSNEELKEAGFTNGEFIKETEKEDNKD